MKILNSIEFVLDNLRENKNMIVTTLIGLVLVVAVLTTTITSTLSFKSEYVDSQVANVGDIHFIAIKSSDSLSSTISIKKTILENAKNHNLADIISYDQLTSMIISAHLYNATTGDESWPSPMLTSLNHSLLEEIKKSPNFRGKLPSNPNETIYIGDKTLEYPLEDWVKNSIQIGKTINLTINAETHLNLSIVGIYSPEVDPISTYTMIDQLFVNYPILISRSFYLDHTSFKNLINTSLCGEISCQVESQFTLAISDKINFWNLKEIYSDVHSFSKSLEYKPDVSVYRYVSKSGSSTNRMTYKLDLVELDSLIAELNNVNILSFFLMLPALLIAISFSNFSSNMFSQQNKDHIKLIRLRGVSTTQLIFVMIIENTLSMILAILLGCGLGMVLTTLKTGLDSLFLFQLQIRDIILWGTTFTGGIIIGRILGLKALDIETPLRSASSQSFWKRNKIDILLLALGMIGNVFFFIFIFDPSLIFGFFPSGLVSILFLTFIIFIFIPFPFFLLLGGVLTLSRIISPILSVIARKLWQRSGNLFSYAITNLVRQKDASTRIIFLFSVIFTIFFAMFTLPSVIHTNNVRNAYYSIGADCMYKSPWNSTLDDILSSDPNIEAAAPMGTGDVFVSSGTALTSFILFPDFLEVAYMEDEFCKEDKIKTLQVTPLSVLVNTKYVEIFRQDVGDTITFFTGDGKTISLTISGIFQYWPNFIINSPSDPNAEPRIIMTNKTLTDLFIAGVTINIIKEGYYLKLSADAETEQLENRFGRSNLLFAQKVAQTTDELIIVRLLRFQIEVLLVLCSLTISTSIFIFGYTQLRVRTRELAVERTLGMKLLQLARIFFYESLISLVFSIFLGIILGIVFTISLISIWMMMLNPSMVPIPVFFFPWREISIQFGLIMFIGLFSSIVPAFLAQKHRIGTALKVI